MLTAQPRPVVVTNSRAGSTRYVDRTHGRGATSVAPVLDAQQVPARARTLVVVHVAGDQDTFPGATRYPCVSPAEQFAEDVFIDERVGPGTRSRLRSRVCIASSQMNSTFRTRAPDRRVRPRGFSTLAPPPNSTAPILSGARPRGARPHGARHRGVLDEVHRDEVHRDEVHRGARDEPHRRANGADARARRTPSSRQTRTRRI